MKVSVSYLSSNFDIDETIKKINDTKSFSIHADVMDGKYVGVRNFYKKNIKVLLKESLLPIDVHLMVAKPVKYLKYFKNEKVKIIYFHPNCDPDNMSLINKITSMNKLPGIVINPDENIKDFVKLLEHINYVLIMSVNPGAGGQPFIDESVERIKELILLKESMNLTFNIAVDGGVDNISIKKINDLNIDYVVVGSYICKSNDYQEKINNLIV
ncbi:MAG: ribulose-phosphate 3-epimerase [bacterium]